MTSSNFDGSISMAEVNPYALPETISGRYSCYSYSHLAWFNLIFQQPSVLYKPYGITKRLPIPPLLLATYISSIIPKNSAIIKVNPAKANSSNIKNKQANILIQLFVRLYKKCLLSLGSFCFIWFLIFLIVIFISNNFN